MTAPIVLRAIEELDYTGFFDKSTYLGNILENSTLLDSVVKNGIYSFNGGESTPTDSTGSTFKWLLTVQACEECITVQHTAQRVTSDGKLLSFTRGKNSASANWTAFTKVDASASETTHKLATPRTISLAGDASGSVQFDGSKDVSITVTVKDDSHNHTISNVDGLQEALNSKEESGAAASALESANSYTDESVDALNEGFSEVILQMYGNDLTENGAPTIRQIAYDEASKITKSDVGLGNVDNTSDANKPVSTAQATAIADAKKAGTDAQTAISNHLKDTSNPHKVDKTDVGLGNVDNTSDANKPVSTAQATAIADAKKAGTDAQSTADGIRTDLTELEGTVSGHVGNDDIHFTATERSKLAGIATGANKYSHPTYTAKNSGFYKVTVDGTGHVSGATAVTKSDITGLGIPAQDTTYSDATTSASGLMSSSDKSKLDGIATGANKTTVDSSLSSTSTNPVQNKVINSALAGKLSTSLKGAANGLAELDANGKVPASQLPSYVDDVIEGTYVSATSFKDASGTAVTGESGKIYVDTTSGKTYRWSGSAFSVISETLALGETSSTAYRGDRGKTAYDHSQITDGNPHGTSKEDLGLGNVENKSSATIRSELTKANVTTALGYTPPTQDTTYGDATTSASGLMSASDKSKLNGIAEGANKYTHPTHTAKSSGFYKVTVDSSGHVSGTTAVTKSDITGLGIPAQDTTYSAMKGASSSAAGSAGLVPAPAAGKQASFLRGDGTWVVPTNTTYDVATQSANGLMSSSDKTKLDGIATGANNYTHPTHTAKSNGFYKVTVDSSGHVSGTTAVAKSDITALGIPAQDTTYSAATTSTAGLMSASDKSKLDGITSGANNYTHPTTSGNKHIPSGGSSGQILRWSADGTAVWGADNNTTYSDATTSASGLMSATDKSKLDGIASGANKYTHPSHTAKSNGFYKVTVDASGHVSGTSAVAKSDITALGIPAQDTTYSAATTSADGLMSKTDKSKLNATNIAYGTCSTDAATAAKVVTVSGNTNWTLAAGSVITIVFSATNTASNPTLNVNGTGAKNVFYNGTQITTSSLGMAGTVSTPMTFMYDGTQYVLTSWGKDNNTTYTNVKLGHGYATCSTAEATTAKVGTLSSYTLTTGGIVAVKFTNAVPAGSTLNINSKGAKAIYYKGKAIVDGVIGAGEVATFIYNGSQYHLLTVDRNRFFTSLVPYGTSIEASETVTVDLNTATYMKVGNYFCSSNAKAKYVSNIPKIDTAFMMQVYSPLSQTVDNETGTWVYRLRKLMYYTGEEYTQYCYTNGTGGNWQYGAWKKIIVDTDTATTSKAGLMSTADKTKLDGLSAPTVTSSTPLTFSVTSDGILQVTY